MTTLKAEFGKRLKKIRKERGISQSALADLAKCETNTISNIETGVHGPRFALLEDIADALEIHPKEFFEFPWPPKRRSR